jgi:hypothetical protein
MASVYVNGIAEPKFLASKKGNENLRETFATLELRSQFGGVVYITIDGNQMEELFYVLQDRLERIWDNEIATEGEK